MSFHPDEFTHIEPTRYGKRSNAMSPGTHTVSAPSSRAIGATDERSATPVWRHERGRHDRGDAEEGAVRQAAGEAGDEQPAEPGGQRREQVAGREEGQQQEQQRLAGQACAGHREQRRADHDTSPPQPHSSDTAGQR